MKAKKDYFFSRWQHPQLFDGSVRTIAIFFDPNGKEVGLTRQQCEGLKDQSREITRILAQWDYCEKFYLDRLRGS